MDHLSTLDELRIRIAEGVYEIDPLMVADAIIRRSSSIGVAQGNTDEAHRTRLGSSRRITHPRSRRAAEPLAA